ncbi:MAG: hypothetical protein ACXV5U_08930 [Ilumatobacteraceae bacterium]
MHVLARIRLMVARHPWVYWLVISALAGVVALGAARAMAAVDAARRSWGEQEAVWVASAAAEPGQPIQADRRQVPRALAPASAVIDDPADAPARQRIASGEIITELDLAAGGAAGLIPHEWLAFAVPAAVAHFAPGDHVRVYSGDQFVAASLVVGRDDSAVMVAIPIESAPAMATALLANTVAVALTPGP